MKTPVTLIGIGEMGGVFACGLLKLDRERLLAAMLTAFEGDPEHKCLGRTALLRLKRAIALADQAGLPATHLRQVAANVA